MSNSATLGAGAVASTTTHAGADIYLIAESKGLFGGVAIEGGVLSSPTAVLPVGCWVYATSLAPSDP
ncbi:MAG: YSC84-related protein [Alphaproteobacteria bacterium]